MASDDIRHAHVGTGKMGLGLVGDLTHEAGLCSTFLSRNKSTNKLVQDRLLADGSYTLELGRDEQPRLVTGHHFVRYDPVNPSSVINKQAIDVLGRANCITTAVGASNLRSIAPVLLEAIKLRCNLENGTHSACPLALIAFENCENNSYVLRDELVSLAERDPAIEEFVRKGVAAYPVIVDRVCSRLSMDPERGVLCHAEDHKELVVAHDSSQDVHPFIRQIGELEAVSLVTTDAFNLYEKRKYWLVNGIHLALGVYAQGKGIFLVNQAMGDPDIRESIGAIQNEFADALAEYASSSIQASGQIPEDFEAGSLHKYNQRVRERFDRQQDPVDRIFRDAQVFEETSAKGQVLAMEFSDHNRELVDSLINKRISRQKYEGDFRFDLGNLLVNSMSPLRLSAFFGRLRAKVCEPVEILLRRPGAHQLTSVPMLLALLGIYADPRTYGARTPKQGN